MTSSQKHSITPRLPHAPQKPHQKTCHNHTWDDPYAWLRDPQWRTPQDGVKDPEILQYIEAENAYTQQYLATQDSRIEKLIAARQAFIPEEDVSVPIQRGDYFYYTRQQRTQNYPVYCRQYQSIHAPEEVIFDQNHEAQHHPFYTISSIRISPNHQYMAYGSDTTGQEFFTLRVRDLVSGIDTGDTLEKTCGAPLWLSNNSGFYYIRLSDEWRSKFLYFHQLGTPQSDDILLYEEPDDIRSLSLVQSFDKNYAFLSSSSKEDDRIFAIKIHDTLEYPQEIVPLVSHRKVDVEHDRGWFYFVTNDQGPQYRLARTLTTRPQASWEEVLAHNPDFYLTGFTPYQNGFVVTGIRDGLDQIGIISRQSFNDTTSPGGFQQGLQYLNFSDPCYCAALHTTTYEDENIRFQYTSLAIPPRVMAVSFHDPHTFNILKTHPVPATFQTEDFVCARIFAPSTNGAQVPVSLVYHRDKVKKDGSNPLLLYGYGSYGYGLSPHFRSHIIPLLEQGFIYAIAHCRGGDELGYQWYLDGKLMHKQNTFDDMIACADTLIAQGYTAAGRIAAWGGSAGGMLMGVIANARPDLFGAIVAEVPFVDVLNTMLDASLPLTPGEYVEWGNPAKTPETFDYIRTYSPYDNVKKQAYPAIFMTGGLTDPRVTYWEPLKWIAKLRHHHTGEAPLFLQMNMGAGHAGGSAREEQIRENAVCLSFIIDQLSQSCK